jgi:FKBP-type peptidyl-prolyl cis-trans isomerase FklB
MDKVSYALGLGIGRQLQDLCGEDLNINDFTQAVRDLLTGNHLAIDEIEGQQLVIEFLQRRDAERKSEQAKLGEAAKRAGEEYLEKNAARSGVTVLPSGLQYEVVREGTGRKPKATDSVKCHYEGTLVDGTVFDSSRRRGEPAVFPLNGVIRGWTEGLQLMQEGAVYRFFIPYNLAYGENGAGASIPPYAALVFEVELIEVI